MAELNEMIDTLSEGIAILEPKDSLQQKLIESHKLQKPLRIKLGFDPTAPDLHLGHAVVAKKLRQFQDFGHTVVVIIGDYTARRGDPSGRKDTRPPLSKEQSDLNAQTYLDQIGLILDMDKVEIHKNSKWYEQKTFDQAIDLAQQFNISRLFERNDFGNRYAAGQSVTLSELMYPGLQGNDSVEIKADIEIGGTDQLYNLLVGRDLQRNVEQSPQIALCMPILPGTDGIIKMSKSKNNYIALTDTPNSMFQKLMALKDKAYDGDEEILVVKTYVDLLISNNDLKSELIDLIDQVESNKLPPETYVHIKKRLAYDVVRQFHGTQKADLALKNSETIQSLKLGSAQLSELDGKTIFENSGQPISLLNLCRLLLKSINVDPVGSNNPKKLIPGNAVKIDGKSYTDIDTDIYPNRSMLISIGKKLAFNITIDESPQLIKPKKLDL